MENEKQYLTLEEALCAMRRGHIVNILGFPHKIAQDGELLYRSIASKCWAVQDWMTLEAAFNAKASLNTCEFDNNRLVDVKENQIIQINGKRFKVVEI